MLVEFIAAVFIALGAGGVAHLAIRLSGKRLPGWLVPAAAGAAMIGFAVWSEYSWAERVKSTLPPEVAVVSQNAITSWYRPWTYVWPLTNRMILIDGRFDRRNAAHPDLLITAVVMMGRWDPGRQVPVVFDCARGLRADLTDDVVIAEDGAIDGADWFDLGLQDPMVRAACDRPAAA
jgi:hypothetical protein